MDALYWRDILSLPDYVNVFLKTKDVMRSFKIKYGKGISLFHHFADD
jgi:hypothetical protein